MRRASRSTRATASRDERDERAVLELEQRARRARRAPARTRPEPGHLAADEVGARATRPPPSSSLHEQASRRAAAAASRRRPPSRISGRSSVPARRSTRSWPPGRPSAAVPSGSAWRGALDVEAAVQAVRLRPTRPAVTRVNRPRRPARAGPSRRAAALHHGAQRGDGAAAAADHLAGVVLGHPQLEHDVPSSSSNARPSPRPAGRPATGRGTRGAPPLLRRSVGLGSGPAGLGPLGCRDGDAPFACAHQLLHGVGRLGAAREPVLEALLVDARSSRARSAGCSGRSSR